MCNSIAVPHYKSFNSTKKNPKRACKDFNYCLATDPPKIPAAPISSYWRHSKLSQCPAHLWSRYLLFEKSVENVNVLLNCVLHHLLRILFCFLNISSTHCTCMCMFWCMRVINFSFPYFLKHNQKHRKERIVKRSMQH